MLRVGPESAGAVPGPAAYGKGGDRPTVTDAAVTLGLIDPSYFRGDRRTCCWPTRDRSGRGGRRHLPHHWSKHG
jgi:N-methylhydantoinase A